MAEQVNPGFDPPRRGSLGDPAKAIGGNSQATQAMASRLQSLERFLQNYREKQVQVRRDDGTFQKIWVLAKEGGETVAGNDEALYAEVVTLPGGAHGVSVSVGYVEYQNAGASESDEGFTGTLEPLMGGVTLDDPAIQPLPLPGVVSFTYLRVKTDSDGVPKFGASAATIEVFPEAQKSVHHIRNNPVSGTKEGDYFFLLLQTEANGSTPPRPIAKKRVHGNRYLPNQLVEFENAGGKREMYKGYLEGPDDKHEFRTVEQIEGEGVEIIEPLNPGAEAEDPVVAPDGTVITAGKPATPPEKEGDTLKWRRISQRKDYPQIHVREEKNEEPDEDGITRSRVLVEGNKFKASEGEVKKFTISIDDGLIKSFAKIEDEDEDGEGWWGTLQILNLSTSAELTQFFEAGSLKRVRATVTAGISQDIPGTKDMPGLASITF